MDKMQQCILILLLFLLECSGPQTFHLSVHYAGQQTSRDKLNKPKHDVMSPESSGSRINAKSGQSRFDKDIGSGNIDA